jgi:hypothetical protein
MTKASDAIILPVVHKGTDVRSNNDSASELQKVLLVIQSVLQKTDLLSSTPLLWKR